MLRIVGLFEVWENGEVGEDFQGGFDRWEQAKSGQPLDYDQALIRCTMVYVGLEHG